MLTKESSVLRSTSELLDKVNPRLRSVMIPWIMRHPRFITALGRMSRSFRKCEKLRNGSAERGVIVPPALILSITSACNLQCSGCLAVAAGNVRRMTPSANLSSYDMDHIQWKSIIKQGNELGVFCYIVAGGEPFMYGRLLDLVGEFRDRLFLIFTNGTAIRETAFERLKSLPNAVIVVSVEGSKDITNDRRGNHVYERAMTAMTHMSSLGILTGISVNINRANVHEWMSSDLLDHFTERGVRLAFLIEHIPTRAVLEGTSIPLDESVLTPHERTAFRTKVLEYKKTKTIFLIHSPGDEEHLGGCVSAGRGFAHVAPSGDLTPCPVSNVATHNLTRSTLEEGLRSPLFTEIRANEHLLETEGMPCALFAHPDEVDELAERVGAYRAGERS